MRIALAQLNLYVGDLDGNVAKIEAAMRRASAARAKALVTPELSVTGYPPEDLLHRADFVDANLAALERLVKASRKTPKLTTIVGFADRREGRLYNAAALIRGGKMIGRYHKQVLPNYGVFDEPRYFTAGVLWPIFQIDGEKVGLTICEDLWEYDGLPARALRGTDVDVIVSMNASPYEMGKLKRRQNLMGRHASDSRALLLYLNAVGAQDELVFDGQSMVIGPKGEVIGRGRAFEEDFLVLDTKRPRLPARKPLPELEEAYSALVLGIREYARKNEFKGAVLGLSGGIDSALTAALASDALDPKNVSGVIMSSRFTSRASVEDAAQVGKRLGLRMLVLPIERVYGAYAATLGRHLAGKEGDLARQNLQARIRGALLMALSNRYGCLVLATGNKSEMSVGYATLYGDMAGGFAPLKDVPKTLVYKLAFWRARRGRKPVIPSRIFNKAPTAELKPNQKDSDSLPPYPVLDPILHGYLEHFLSVPELIRAGHPKAHVHKTARMVEKSEYKRRQAPPGVKISGRILGRDRRVPISHAFRPWGKS